MLQQLAFTQAVQVSSPVWGAQVEPPELELDAAEVVNPELDAAEVVNPELDAAEVVNPELDAATDVVNPELDATDVVKPELDATDVVKPELDAVVMVPLHGPAQEALTQVPSVAVVASAAGHCPEQKPTSVGYFPRHCTQQPQLLASWAHAIASAQQLCLVQAVQALSPGAIGHRAPVEAEAEVEVEEEAWVAPPIPVVVEVWLPLEPPDPKVIAWFPPQAPVATLPVAIARTTKPSTNLCRMSPSAV